MGLKKNLRRLKFRGKVFVLDTVDSILGSRPPLVPPRWLNHDGITFDGADETVQMLKDYAGLTRDVAILDLGCGIGRIASSLTKELSPEGRYVGVDIVERAIDWMRDAYRPYPNFSFHHLDVHSSAYNPQGRLKTDEIDFAFLGDQKFDIVFMISVFTHLYPQHVRHYLNLIRGILKPDGRLFTSVFINDDFAKERQRLGEETRQKLTSRNFRFVGDGFYAPRSANPELAVAFDPLQIEDMWSGAGMKLEQPFRYGSWCGRPGAHDFYQDVIISRPA